MAELRSCIPLRNGRNNQVFRLDLAKEKKGWQAFCSSAKKFGQELSPPDEDAYFPTDHETVILKRYFQHPEDLRPRLKSEFSFLSFAWKHQIQCIPKPLVCNYAENWGLYSYVPGNSIASTDVTEEAIQQALHFFITLNKFKQAASHLSHASEACVRSWDYYESVEKRIAKLLSMDHAPVSHFIQTELLPKWERIKQQTASIAHWSLAPDELCVTPSDFGFHNALIHEGKFSFLDFEYAGWDDPAKTACDFFCQPKIPVPQRHFESSCKAIAEVAAHPERCLKRIQAIFPICQIKWCCILLGGIAGIGKARRSFAHCNEQEQLKKTGEYLCRI